MWVDLLGDKYDSPGPDAGIHTQSLFDYANSSENNVSTGFPLPSKSANVAKPNQKSLIYDDSADSGESDGNKADKEQAPVEKPINRLAEFIKNRDRDRRSTVASFEEVEIIETEKKKSCVDPILYSELPCSEHMVGWQDDRPPRDRVERSKLSGTKVFFLTQLDNDVVNIEFI